MHWNSLLSSTSPDLYYLCYQEFKQLFAAYPDVLEYLNNTWLSLKENIADPWVSEYSHFGSIASSRVEGAHAVLKKFIQKCTHDFLSAFMEIDNNLRVQANECHQKLAHERSTVPTLCRDQVYVNVV